MNFIIFILILISAATWLLIESNRLGDFNSGMAAAASVMLVAYLILAKIFGLGIVLLVLLSELFLPEP